MDQILSLPFGAAWALLFVIVLIRTSATYWAGRGIAAGAARSRGLAERLERPGPAARIARAQRILDRWGPFAIVLTYLTIGLQTAVNLAAGLGGMHVRRHLPAAAVGSVIWAFVYATVGLAAFDLWFEHLAGSPWMWMVIAAVAMIVVVRVLIVARLRGSSARGTRGLAAAPDSLDEASQRGEGQERSGT